MEDGIRKTKCKYYQITYSFPNERGTDHSKRYLENAHLPNKPQQAQLNIFGGNLGTFKYNL